MDGVISRRRQVQQHLRREQPDCGRKISCPKRLQPIGRVKLQPVDRCHKACRKAVAADCWPPSVSSFHSLPCLALRMSTRDFEKRLADDVSQRGNCG